MRCCNSTRVLAEVVLGLGCSFKKDCMADLAFRGRLKFQELPLTRIPCLSTCAFSSGSGRQSSTSPNSRLRLRPLFHTMLCYVILRQSHRGVAALPLYWPSASPPTASASSCDGAHGDAFIVARR